MKKLILCLLLLAFCSVSCGQKEQKSTKKPSASPSIDVQLQTESEVTPTPTMIPRNEKKTIEEALRGLIYETPEEVQAKYFTAEFDGVRHDKLAEWKGSKGKYRAPKGYKIEPCSPRWCTERMASQQMPRELLDEIGTEELYQLIMDLPLDVLGWGLDIRDTYLEAVAKCYVSYNFMTDLIRRNDSAEVVHRYYQKYSKKEKLKYTKNHFLEEAKGKELNESKATKEELVRKDRFQLTEALEWFFKYKEGETMPEEEEEMLGLGCYGHY